MKTLRLLLFPITIFYILVSYCRNKLFDWGIKKSQQFDLPIINVGNLRVGGTGKTPHVELIARLLSQNHKLAILSRGYGRLTKGFIEASPASTASEIGDEPMQYYTKFNERSKVYVGEKRVPAIQRIIENDKPEVIVLDDAYQHRYVQASFNILLTSYKDEFHKDYVLPSGNLRELRSGAKRADLIIVTKSKADLSITEKNEIKSKVSEYCEANTPILFSWVDYGEIPKQEEMSEKVIVAAGIAHNQSFLKQVKKQFQVHEFFSYRDHHNFTEDDVNEWAKTLEASGNLSILTTEKDYVRLMALELPEIIKQNLYFWPIEVKMSEEDTSLFKEIITTTVSS